MAQASSKAQLNEERATAASYVIDFYTQVAAINDAYARYVNTIAKLSGKYGYNAEKMDDNENQEIVQVTQLFRYHVIQAYIRFKTMKQTIERVERLTGNYDQLDELYTKIKQDLIINSETMENIAIQFNSFLSDVVMRHLLESSQDFLKQIYGENNA